MASPNLICSPDSHNIIKDVVFEPRQPQSELLNQQPQESVYGQRRPPQRNYSILKKKKSVRINDSASETAAMLDEVARRRQYRVGLNLFNQSPDLGIEYLLKKDFLDYSPASVGKFLRGRKGLSKMMIGNYLCQLQRPFNLAALHCFVHEMDFSGLHLDIALRHLYAEVTPPTSEAQKVEKIVEVFAKRYIACNQMFAASFKTSDSLFVLAYAVVLLNTDLHTKALRPSKRMKREDFVANLRGIDLGQDLDTEMLQGIYDRIKANELKAGLDHVSQVARVEETIIHKKKVSSPRPLMAVDTSRRLVCFCRLTEVPELHKKAKLKAEAGQRGVFLFNDVLVVTKTVTKKDKTLHQFKYRLDLNSIRINVFSTAQYQFGVQLQDRLTGKVSATFNSRSEADQQRFVNDLQESVAEMAEMARAKSGLNEVINGNNIDQEDAYETLC
jgi:IQ motif/SEC7 domain-containing protein